MIRDRIPRGASIRSGIAARSGRDYASAMEEGEKQKKKQKTNKHEQLKK
jgi:hypothetical protein